MAWSFYWRAHTKYDVHSPFVAQLLQDVIEDQREYYCFGKVRALRHHWEQVKESITLAQDYGAGSRAGQGYVRSLAAMAKHSGVGERTGKLLFRLAHFLRAEHILELGTNLGFSSSYLLSANTKARLITIEGIPEIAAHARRSWRLMDLPPPDVRVGTFREELPRALTELGQVDLLWLDGDHRGAAMEDYVQQCLPYCHAGTALVLGDIHWSGDMWRSWENIRRLPEVSQSIELFNIGLIFFRQAPREKQHFILIPAWMKPWRMGFFRPAT